MSSKWITRAVLIFCMGTVAGTRTEAFEDWMMDYSALTLDTLPPPAMVIERVIGAAPFSAARMERWERRIRRSALLPQFRIDYVMREIPIHHYAPNTVTERIHERGGGQTRTDTVVERGGGQTQSEALTYDTERIGGGPDQSFVETRRQDRDIHTDRHTLHRDIDTHIQGHDLHRTMVREGQVFPTGQELEWANEWRAMVLWDLSRLVFHHEETRAVDVQVRESNHRRVLVGEVARRYGELREALTNLERDPDDMRWQTVRLVEASFLDAMSDYFITDYIQMKLLDQDVAEEHRRIRRAIEERRPDAVVPPRELPVPEDDDFYDDNDRRPTDPELLREIFDDDIMDMDDRQYYDDLYDLESR